MPEPFPGKVIELSGHEVYSALDIEQKALPEKRLVNKRQGHRRF
jgi:hypothetical protein